MSAAAITNIEFLEALFEDMPDDAAAMLCGFSGDPNDETGERRAAIKKMAASGYGPETISSLTKIHIAMIQAIIREPSQPESST